MCVCVWMGGDECFENQLLGNEAPINPLYRQKPCSSFIQVDLQWHLYNFVLLWNTQNYKVQSSTYLFPPLQLQQISFKKVEKGGANWQWILNRFTPLTLDIRVKKGELRCISDQEPKGWIIRKKRVVKDYTGCLESRPMQLVRIVENKFLKEKSRVRAKTCSLLPQMIRLDSLS